MRISDWSSDVCSSDLAAGAGEARRRPGGGLQRAGDDPDRRRRLLCLPRTGDDLPAVASVLRHSQIACGHCTSAANHSRCRPRACPEGPFCRGTRSEEHTSELQSLMRISYAVFCLKKKNLHIIEYPQYTNVS